MAYDPAWDMPQPNWQQQGSWEQGTIFPVVEPDAGTQVWLGPVAREWLPWICGALDQMRNPSAAIVANDTAMFNHLRRVDTLLGLVCGNGGSQCPVQLRLNNCVLEFSCDSGTTYNPVPGWAENFQQCVQQAIPPPPILLPPGQPVQQRACAVAGYLATDIIKASLDAAINAYNMNLSLLAFAGNIAALTFAFELPWTAAAIYAAYDIYKLITASTIADFNAASGDSTLWSQITCAIFNVIRTDGQVTRANGDAVIAAICATTYAHPEVVTALCNYATTLGVDGLLALEVPGPLAVVDCSGCGGGWCYTWDFTAAAGLWVPQNSGQAVWHVGTGWQSVFDGTNSIFQLTIPFTHTIINRVSVTYSVPLSTSGSDDRNIYWYRSGSQIAIFGLSQVAVDNHTDTTGPLTLDTDRLYVHLDNINQSGVSTLESITVHGSGANPFGATNCS